MMNLTANDPHDDPFGASEFEIQQPDGSIRVGGCLERNWTPEASPFKPWGSVDSVPMVNQSAWVEQESLRPYQRRTMDQNGYPACCLASLANALELAMVRDGRQHIALDWLAAWKKLSGGRGGVALDSAAEFARSTGFPRADGKGVVRIAEAWDCASIEALASALQRGAICTFGHEVHAECMTRMVKQAGIWVGDVDNSWGDWGDPGGPNNEYRGWHYVPLSKVEMRYSIIAIRELEFTADMTGWEDAK